MKGHRRRLLLIAGVGAVAICVLAVFVGASFRSVSAVPWSLKDIDDHARTITVLVRLTGVVADGRGCMGVRHSEVSETKNSVDLKVYVWRKLLTPRDLCPADLVFQEVKIQLEAPLGSRALEGCLGPNNCRKMSRM